LCFSFHRHRQREEEIPAARADAVVMCVAFDGCTSGKRRAPGDAPRDPDAPLAEGSEQFVARLAHLMSLMHGLALQHLRGDVALGNLTSARRRTDGGPQLPELKHASIKKVGGGGGGGGGGNAVPAEVGRGGAVHVKFSLPMA
jgi:hypothetical protein